MNKYKTQPNFSLNGQSLKHSNLPNCGKKVEGFDRASRSDCFVSKIEKLKKKPEQQSLEDQYVKGLQDEIHYMEMELKLLREKEIAKHSQVDQLETFFGDGIPINENILAIKNGFNNYRHDCDRKIVELTKEKRERTDLIQGIKSRAKRLTEEVEALQKGFKDDLLGVGAQTHAKIKEDCHLREEIEQKEESLRNLKGENRKYSELISTFLRNKEIESVALLKSEGHRFSKLNKTRESIAKKEKEQEGLEKKYEEMKKQEEEKTYVIKLEENNLKMRKKAISLEKELNSLLIKIEEKKLELQERLKERQKEITAKMDMRDRLNDVNEAIDRENGLTIQDLERHAAEDEITHLQKIIDKNRKVSKYVSFYGQLVAQVEDEIQVFGEQKPDLKRELQAYKIEAKNLQKDIGKAQQRRIEVTGQIAEGKSRVDFTNGILPTCLERSRKNSEKRKMLEAEKEKFVEDLRMREKQLELVEILKGLSLESVQISNSSNAAMQDGIISFIKNWESLFRS